MAHATAFGLDNSDAIERILHTLSGNMALTWKEKQGRSTVEEKEGQEQGDLLACYSLWFRQLQWFLHRNPLAGSIRHDIPVGRSWRLPLLLHSLLYRSRSPRHQPSQVLCHRC